VGLLTDVTGAASTVSGVEPGVKARVGLANSGPGPHIKLVVADTGSTPSGALAAAKTLVLQDHVFAVLGLSVLNFGAAAYLASQGVPVVGGAWDGPAKEWQTNRNMFSVLGPNDPTKVTTIYGNYFKLQGAQNFATLGLSVDPSSSESAKGAAASVENAGIKAGYVNVNLPIGTTNVAPIALAMKNAGVDSLWSGVNLNTDLALIQALHQQGVTLKATLLPLGYGGDLLSAGPAAQEAAQGLGFSISYQPVEMHTPATERFQATMSRYGGVRQDPTYYEYVGYVAVDALLTGLRQAGNNPSRQQFINTMLGVRRYDAAGLVDGHPFGFAMDQRGFPAGAQTCQYATKFSGQTFQLVPGADPICGTLIPGKTMGPSS
jgi:branched-chain amino acid transport system substrate-binding protein